MYRKRIYADHFNGPGRVVDPIYVGVLVCIWIILNRMTFDLVIGVLVHFLIQVQKSTL